MVNVIGQVSIELERQDRQWGQQDHDSAYWMSILMEEVGEAASAVIECRLADYRQELIQVAAVAIQAIHCLDRFSLGIDKN